MPLTHLPHGLSAMGLPSPGAGAFAPSNGKTHYWVHGNEGFDGADGTDPEQALLTMAEAFSRIASGDVIHVMGNIREQLSTPAGIFDVTIIGEGTKPRHADAHTGNNGYQTATWKPPAAPTATTPHLTIRQQGWRIVNMLLVAPADAAAAIAFMRDAAAGDLERDSSHGGVYGCRFAGGVRGIQNLGTENVFDIDVIGNIFNDLTYAMYSAAAYSYRWRIFDNVFNLNTNHLVMGHTQSQIKGNVFGAATTGIVVLTGGAGKNDVNGNYLSGTYADGAAYAKANANDNWMGNFGSTGVTTGVPA